MSIGAEGSAYACGRRHQGDHRHAYTFDETKIITRNFLVEKSHRSFETEDARLTETLELSGEKLRERDCFASLLFQLFGLESVLVELKNVLQQTD